MNLSISILLLSIKSVPAANIIAAKKLLEYFVFQSKEHYGDKFCVYNVHGLLHISDDVEHFSMSLDEISCFQFENHLQKLKKTGTW